MAKKNAVNNQSGELTIDPGTGDSFVQFDINGTGEFRIGVDDDASDAFKISQGSALGTNDTFVVTAAGEITKPLTPAFLAYLGTTDSNVTGDGTSFTLGSGNALTEVFDQNNDFVTTGTFTAPVTGKYRFDVCVTLSGLTTSHTNMDPTIITSNRSYTYHQVDPGNVFNASTEYAYCATILTDMDASDTATIRINVSGSTKVVDVLGGATLQTWFSGNLEC